jgi:hypothetical protein
MIVNGFLALAGSLGLIKLVSYIKLRYYLWSGKKCKKCRDNNCCSEK